MFDLYIDGRFFERTWSLQLTIRTCKYKADRNGFSHYFWLWPLKWTETGSPCFPIRADSIDNINMRILR
jgi:hypothetical protein